jgi:hypothetical protein
MLADLHVKRLLSLRRPERINLEQVCKRAGENCNLSYPDLERAFPTVTSIKRQKEKNI